MERRALEMRTEAGIGWARVVIDEMRGMGSGGKEGKGQRAAHLHLLAFALLLNLLDLTFDALATIHSQQSVIRNR